MEISEQIAALERINRLLANEDFQKELLPWFQQLHDNAHAALVSPDTTGPALEFARARYVAARDLLHYLRDRKNSLERVLKAKQGEK